MVATLKFKGTFNRMTTLLYFVTEDWYFVSHRFNLALAAQRQGYEVVIVTRCLEYRQLLEKSGFTVIPFEASRRSLNPFALLSEALALANIYRKISPSIVHHVALRPVVVGAFAARLSGIRCVVSAITGLGFIFVEGNRVPLAQRILFWLFPRLLSRGLTIVQNTDDRDLLLRSGLKPQYLRLIPGAGVDTVQYTPQLRKDNDRRLVVLMASRLLWDKGVGEFIQAARLLRETNLKFVLVGQPDPSNPATVSQADVDAWLAEGVITYLGHRDDMHVVLQEADIVCLPSYREGFPKVLLEAMACGLPCITTDVPGCRAAIRHNDNGLLIPVNDSLALANAISTLAQNQEMRSVMGQRGRTRALEEFSQEQINKMTLLAYQEVLSA
jgi:glycosyltransferase involved in cell wall biosynthesis